MVLQHPTEFRRSTISTVPLLSLVLQEDNVDVIVGRKFDLESGVIKDAVERNYTLALLYPSEEAIDLDNPTVVERELLGMLSYEEQQQEQQQHVTADTDKKTLLIAVDGTWGQAKRMFYNSPDLLSICHQIQFTANTTTVYDRIRTEPDDHCISTSEAVAEALVRLEPNGQRAKQHIHAALEKLVQVQLQYSQDDQQSDPRFQRRKLRAFNRQQVRIELEQSLFNDTIFDLGDAGGGGILRPLTQKDVMYISRVNDDRSIHKISDLIRYHPNYCFGIERNEELIACILRYRSGEIGMLHVDPNHRRMGYASILIREFVRRLRTFEDADYAETFIMDGNDASQATFSALGWIPEDENQKKGTGKRKAKRKWIYPVQTT